MLAEPADPMWGGLHVWDWIALFYDTHTPNGMGAFLRLEWPEPGGLADQPDIVVRALHEVAAVIYAEASAQSGNLGN